MFRIDSETGLNDGAPISGAPGHTVVSSEGGVSSDDSDADNSARDAMTSMAVAGHIAPNMSPQEMASMLAAAEKSMTPQEWSALGSAWQKLCAIASGVRTGSRKVVGALSGASAPKRPGEVILRPGTPERVA